MNSLTVIADSLSAGTLSASSLITLTRKQSAQVAVIRASALDGNLSDCVLSVDKGVSQPVTTAALHARAAELAQSYVATGNPSKMVVGINTLLGMCGAPLMSAKKGDLLVYQAAIAQFVRFTKSGERKPAVRAAWEHKLSFLQPVYQAIDTVNEPLETPFPSLDTVLDTPALV